ncbi:MAG: glycine/sarcosine/betaine reductase component B subunit [Deltaproteobacteria bacterium]|nr:glycine/sarcosine/betaine reductase component B subunit [Deltaproteobacteria bacterium]
MQGEEFPFMKLELRKFTIKDARFGEVTGIEQGTLVINKQELVEFLNRDHSFAGVEVKLARPGEAVRIVHVMDAVQPRLKLSGDATPFPGALGPVEIAGRGQTNVLDGVAVLQTGKRQGIQEGVVDMAGPGADYSIFSRTINVVLLCTPHPATTDVEFDRATRKAALEAAVYLAGPTRPMVPDHVEVFDLGALENQAHNLPRVVYIYHLQSQGLLRETFVYGEHARELLPTILHPNEVLDGAIVSSNYIIACQKNPTYLHLHNPVVLELARRHGRDLIFAGVVIANEHSTLREKERSAKFAAKLAWQLGAQGAVITQEGGGHADTDLMLTCRECEQLGIKTVIMANEIAGAAGDLPSLVDTVPEAEAVVTTGNNDELVSLDPVEQVLGGEDIAGVAGPPDAGLTIALGRIYAATNQLGATHLSIRGY